MASREDDYRPGAPCMDCGEYPGPRHERSDCVRALRRRLADLVALWEDNHANWCCTKGCSSPDGRHVGADAMHDWLEKLGRGEDPGELDAEPCTGQCSCDVGLYVSSLRAALVAAS